MSDKKNPYAAFSFEDVMKQIQDNPMMKAWQESEIFQTMMGQNSGKFDMQALWDAQQKNLERLNEINTKVGDNVKELAQKQASMMGEAWESVKDYSQNAMQSGDADMGKNMEQAQAVFQKATANFQELSQRGMAMSEDMAKNLQDRMKESVDDLQKLAEKYRK